MNIKIADLRKRTNAAKEHRGTIKHKTKRFIEIKKIADNTTIAKENKTDYKYGCNWIKKILKFKKEHKFIYMTGKQAPLIFKKFSNLNRPEAIRRILIATVNPELTIEKIDSMVKELFNKDFPKKDKRTILLSMIRDITHDHYEYLLY